MAVTIKKYIIGSKIIMNVHLDVIINASLLRGSFDDLLNKGKTIIKLHYERIKVVVDYLFC